MGGWLTGVMGTWSLHAGKGLLPALLALVPMCRFGAGTLCCHRCQGGARATGMWGAGCRGRAAQHIGRLGSPRLRAETKSVGSCGPPAAGAGGRNPTKSCCGRISGRGEGHAAEPPPPLPLSIPAIDCLNSSGAITMSAELFME